MGRLEPSTSTVGLPQSWRRLGHRQRSRNQSRPPVAELWRESQLIQRPKTGKPGVTGLGASRIMRAMPRVCFTPQLRRFTATPEVDSPATTLRAALEDAFAVNPVLRGYVLDDQGHVRANVVIFIDGRRSTDRIALTEPLAADSTVHVLQALSGG
jgi:hypothetical protein